MARNPRTANSSHGRVLIWYPPLRTSTSSTRLRHLNSSDFILTSVGIDEHKRPSMPATPASSAAAAPSGSTKQEQLESSLRTLVTNYKNTTPARVKLIDSFLLFLIISGITQFAYRVLVTSHPYNAFAGG